MWSKRTQDELPQRPEKPAGAPPASAVPSTEPPRRETNTMSSPSRVFDPEPISTRSTGPAALGKNVTIKGQIFAREDLTIDGEVEGTVECQEHRLTIGPNARVQAGLKAREIIIHGSIQGNVDATDKIDIKKEAKLVGDIKTSRIVIEDGAYFKGSIDISKAVVNKPAPQPAAAPQPAPQPAAAVPNAAAAVTAK
ncbi:MAG: polymer-forming cytoskeletal protein [Acidobacteriaceae bacterium]|nr:polymer-forming cytoskeletal protein [Acidobacteriaceae bacterium]MBV9308567.1 polymer-forming cytoskeletal protein [Acidobacteriaceae bacterium]